MRFGNSAEGSGASCIKPFEWVAGREYMLRIWIMQNTSDGVNWGGWIKDTVTGEETLIGVITLKNSFYYQGYGLLASESIGFHQNYGYGSVESCSSLPYSKVTWRGPYANNNTYVADKAETRFDYVKCNNSNSYASHRPFVSIESGSGITRKIPSGTSLWEKFFLSIGHQGNGSGSVKSTPAGIDCGNTCTANFAANTFITLTAQADAGSQFSGWNGACSGLSQQCNVRMTDAQNVTAHFTTTAPTRLITVNKTGNGLGFTSSNPDGLGCMALFCGYASASFKTVTAVTITAEATGNSYFTGWGGACSGTGTCYIAPGNTSVNVTANFIDNDNGGGGGSDNGPLADTARFVRQQFWDFLGTYPDDASLNESVKQLNAGTLTRARFAQSLMETDIFQGRFDPIVRLYTAYFKRLPDYSGLMYWHTNMYPNNGLSGSNLAQVSEAFAQSSEFVATYGPLNNHAFITRVYQNVLGRDPESSGHAYWVGRLAQGMPRGEVMVGFSESAENKQASANSQLVTLTYVGMLRRAPQTSEHDRWVTEIQAGRASAQSLINSMLQSPEYQARF